MSNFEWKSWWRLASAMVFLFLGMAEANLAQAVPSFARQTNLECTSCHLSWLELTPTGRNFKLSGYTLGERQPFPIAGMLQVSSTSTNNVDPSAPDQFPRNNEVVLQQASLFLSGKLADHLGVFSQWSYDGVAHHSGADNIDLRYANRLGSDSGRLLYGFTLHNNPTVQDVFNTGPAWGFPFAASGVAIAPNAATALESLGQQVAGMGAYALWNNTLYGELTAYRTADQIFSVLRAGTDRAEDAALRGYNPYWRLALQHEWGEHSAMIGAYGAIFDRYPDNTNPSGPTDRFKDLGIDGQYQYLTDRHRLSAQFNLIREKQDWNATPMSNASDTLNTFRSKLTYYYQLKYGVNVSYFSTWGDTDNVFYNTGDPITGSINGSPDTSGYIWELNYLPKRDIRLVLQYTDYTKFNGAKNNYDGFGRNARDNNTWYFLGWFMF